MPPVVRTVLGWILVVVGVIDLLKFGLAFLVQSPQLIIGIVFLAGGAALLGAGRKSTYLP